MRNGTRATNRDIPEAWARGTPARTATFWTDGDNLWSYDRKIGVTENGCKVLYEYTARGVWVSTTTSQHVGYARPFANETRTPERT